jgi:hemerythrin
MAFLTRNQNYSIKVKGFDILNHLNKWLLEHIKQTDKAYSEFMNKNGIN